MYAVKQDGAFAGYADSIVPIRLHGNGCYVPCKEDQAEGFCAKMAVIITDREGTEHQVLSQKAAMRKWARHCHSQMQKQRRKFYLGRQIDELHRKSQSIETLY